MFNHFICGTGSFHQEEDDPWGPSSTPKRSRKNSCNKKNNKNPYSKRGLDKFATVLADLEERRQKIQEQIGSQDVSLVRFVYSNSKGWEPIVVKLGDQKHDKIMKLVDGKDKPEVMQNSESLDKSLIELSATKEVEQRRRPGSEKKSLLLSLKRPYYLPMVMVLILLCLVIYGRSFAILCTSIWWYLAPMMKGGDSNLRRSMKKKEYVRSCNTEKKMDSHLLKSMKSMER